MSDVFAPASATASAIVSKTGTPSTSCPPLQGVTPATRFVPYALLRRPWKRPSEPVRPATTRRVSLSTMIATSAPPGGSGADPGARKASQARTQGGWIWVHIDPTEDAAWRSFAAARAVPDPPGGALSLDSFEDHGRQLEPAVAETVVEELGDARALF